MRKRIRDIAEIRTGYQFRGKVEAAPDANMAVIQIKDVDDRLNVSLNDLVPVRLDNPGAYRVLAGDVLFLSRGHRQYAAVVPGPVGNTIATGYFFILRPNQQLVRSEFLAWSINQPEFRELVRPFTRGTHMPMVSKTDFQDLTIKVPPFAVQDQIIQLQKLCDRERQLTASLQQKQAELIQAVSRQLLSSQLKSKERL